MYKMLLAMTLAAGLGACTCPTGSTCGPAWTSGKTDANTGNPITPSSEADAGLYNVVCGDGTCNAYVLMPYSELHSCFSTGGAWDITAPLITPVELRGCDPAATSGYCTVYGSFSCSVTGTPLGLTDCTDAPSCAQLGGPLVEIPAASDRWVDPSGYCAWDYNSADLSNEETLQSLEEAMNAQENCTTDFTNIGLVLSTTPFASATCTPGCDGPESRMVHSGTNHGLLITKASSYLQISRPGLTTVQVPIHGSAAVDTVGKKIKLTSLEFDNASFAGTALADWHCYQDAEMSYTTGSGTSISMTAAQVTAGQAACKGTAAGVTKAGWAQPGASVSGHINLSAMTWDLTETEVEPGPAPKTTLTLHLVGTIWH